MKCAIMRRRCGIVLVAGLVPCPGLVHSIESPGPFFDAALREIGSRTIVDGRSFVIAEVEARMGFPRDYLQFTTWYLRNKKYITQADNSDYTLTVLGVDFVESNRAQIPILNKLLTSGADKVPKDPTLVQKALPARQTLVVPEAAEPVGTGSQREDSY